MAIVADRVVVELEAKMGKYDARLRKAEATFTKTTKAQERQIRSLEKQIKRSSNEISGTLKGLAASFATYFSVREIIQITDEFTRFQNLLKVVGLEGENLAATQEKLREIGNRYGVELGALANVFNRATLAQKELGASNAEIIRLNEIVGAGLKVTGSSAESARGALLQLSQALGQDVVRAEEFNSILEGALPIAQAAARGIDRFGGSVAALRSGIIEGNVTSKEFFQGILAGGEVTLLQAEKATLTLANSLTVLRNELTLYIGEAGKSGGVTEAVSAGIIALSENIDTLAKAMATLAVVFGVKFVAGALAARGALVGTAAQMGIVGSASFALQARIAGAATGMQALGFAARGAGASMLAAFGGPVGVAIAALSVGVIYYTTQVESAADQTARLNKQIADAESTAKVYEDRLAAAGVSVDGLGDKSEGSASQVDVLSNAMQTAIGKANALIAKLKELGVVEINTRLAEIEGERQRIRGDQRRNRDPFLGQTKSGLARRRVQQGDGPGSNNARLAGLDREKAALERQRKAIFAGVSAGVDVTQDAPTPTAPAAPKVTKPKKGPRGKSPETLAREAEREARRVAEANAAYASELEQMAAEELSLRADLTGSIADRLAAERARIDAETASFQRQLVLDEDLTEEQRAQLFLERSKADNLQRQLVEREAALANLERENRLAAELNGAEQGLLQAQLDLVDDREQRKAIELKLLRLSNDQERADLEMLIASLELNGTKQRELAIAKRRLALLEQQEDAEEENVRRGNESPLERYKRELNKTPGQLNDDFERIAVDGLDALNDGITDAITGAKSLGEAFGNVADQIIADLIRIAVQQLIIKPLTESLFGDTSGGGGGGGGLGGIGSFIAGLFGGRASGGHVVGGKMYRVTDGEGFQPAGSGKIHSLGAMRNMGAQAAPGGSSTVVNVSVSAPGANEQTVTLIRQTIADAAPTIVQAAQRATVRSLQRKRIT